VQGYQVQGYQVQGYQVQGYQVQGYQSQGIQAGWADAYHHFVGKGAGQYNARQMPAQKLPDVAVISGLRSGTSPGSGSSDAPTPDDADGLSDTWEDNNWIDIDCDGSEGGRLPRVGFFTLIELVISPTQFDPGSVLKPPSQPVFPERPETQPVKKKSPVFIEDEKTEAPPPVKPPWSPPVAPYPYALFPFAPWHCLWCSN
jgi:hypothetical protein